MIKKTVFICSAITGLLVTACNKTQHQSSDMETHENVKAEGTYACPMHPEITGDKGAKCSKCGMELELSANSEPNSVAVKITATPEKVEAGKPTKLAFSITGNGKNVTLDVVHEQKIHLLIVDEELTWFDHIHTEELADGRYTATEIFPHSGNFIVYTDFKVDGSAGSVDKQMIAVEGGLPPKPSTATTKWTSSVDGYTVTLANGNDFKTKRPQDIGITIQKNGRSIAANDIEPYLGAVAHIIVIGKADKNFLHVHPGSTDKFPIHGETRFEKPGAYRMWVQFQTNGKVHTADFTVNVVEGAQIIDNQHSGHHH